MTTATRSQRAPSSSSSPALGTARVRPLFIPQQDAREVVTLRDGALWTRVPAPTGLSVTCVSGSLWITQAGGGDDVIVRPGASFVTRSRGKVVVQAMGEASFRFEDGR